MELEQHQPQSPISLESIALRKKALEVLLKGFKSETSLGELGEKRLLDKEQNGALKTLKEIFLSGEHNAFTENNEDTTLKKIAAIYHHQV